MSDSMPAARRAAPTAPREESEQLDDWPAGDAPDETSGLVLAPTPLLRPVRHADAFEGTVEKLATAIRLGTFPRGSMLPPERELAMSLGVARMTLREAIAALRQAGMVQTRRGRGGGSLVVYDGHPRSISRADGDASIEPDLPTGPELVGLLDFRRVVEPGSAYLAARRALTGAQRAELVAALDTLTEAADRADDGAHRVADSRLHVTIARLSGSAPLAEGVSRCQGVLHRLLGAIPVLPPNIAHSRAEHIEIVDAVLGGDADGAREVAERHCDHTSALLRGLLG